MTINPSTSIPHSSVCLPRENLCNWGSILELSLNDLESPRFAQKPGLLTSFPENLEAGPGAKDHCFREYSDSQLNLMQIHAVYVNDVSVACSCLGI